MSKNLKLFTALTYLVMITLNALANIIPTGGEGTGVISDSYPNLFAPAGYTFGIWGVIYLLLGVFVLFLVRQHESDMNPHKPKAFKSIAVLFSISSLANAAWILAWHYRLLAISVVLMLVILGCLIRIMGIIKYTHFSHREIIRLKPPIGVYLGWISVATIANITAFLVNIQWNRFGLSESFWLITLLIAGVCISVATMRWSSCSAYGLVVIWAYIGILVKHTSPSGFNHLFPSVIWILYAALTVLAVSTVLTMTKSIKAMKN